LGCKNLLEVYELTWREYLLKRDGYIREIKNRQYTTRTIAYYSLVATGAIDTKKMSMEKFMPLEEKTNVSNDEQKELLKQMMQEALTQAKEKANG
jgi:hypothetical protein